MKSRTNRQWVEDLSGAGPAQVAAIEDLWAYLVKAAHASFRRFPGYVGGMDSQSRDQLAEDCAQEALVAILAQLPQFRGDSRFTTWAYKFGVNIAMTAARRERWKGASLEELLEDDEPISWLLHEPTRGQDPERQALASEALAVVRQVIEHDLTERQRTALKGVVIQEAPLDEVARLLGTNRNGAYKLIHDARRKLKAKLLERGFASEEILTVSAAEG